MKTILINLLLLSSLIVWIGCGQKSNDHEVHSHGASKALSDSDNDALYNEVMKIHDEVMPKMNDIYSIKQALSKKIVETPSITDERKLDIETTIAELDSANDGMMIWMRQFDPIPDSLGKERAREYLENEMEKVKKVRDDIIAALEKAEAVNK